MQRVYTNRKEYKNIRTMKITNECNMELMKRYPDNHFELAIVDPPYFDGPQKLGYYGANVSGSGVVRKGYKEIGSWQLPEEKYFKELFRVSKHQIIWGCNYYANHIPNVGRIIWDKVNGSSSFSDCEIASVSTHESVRMYSYMWNGFMQGSSADGKKMEGNKRLNEKRIHPTQKPVKLYEWLLMKYAKEGDKILDTHLGSGSVSIACHNLKFDLTACELDKEYYTEAMKRLDDHVSQIRMF